jgi:alkylation response protein AidB-like acyl-CoA dehydrogenase
MDLTRRAARLEFAEAPAETLAVDAGAALARACDTAVVLLAAEQLGGASRVLEMAVGYARERVQFGRTIGSFQAIKHRCADLLMEVELARSVVYHALGTAAAEPAALPVESALAAAVSGDAYLRAAAANIQIHGGIGFTWEHPAHLYLKRAKSSSLLFGPPAAHRQRLAGLIGIAS